jgi:hypothetical protein
MSRAEPKDIFGELDAPLAIFLEVRLKSWNRVAQSHCDDRLSRRKLRISDFQELKCRFGMLLSSLFKLRLLDL